MMQTKVVMTVALAMIFETAGGKFEKAHWKKRYDAQGFFGGSVI